MINSLTHTQERKKCGSKPSSCSISHALSTVRKHSLTPCEEEAEWLAWMVAMTLHPQSDRETLLQLSFCLRWSSIEPKADAVQWVEEEEKDEETAVEEEQN